MAHQAVTPRHITELRRIALVGAVANPNFGDDAILEATLDRIDAMLGRNAIVLVLTKDVSYTRRMSGFRHSCEIIPTDALHRLSVACGYSFDKIMSAEPAVLGENGAKVPDDVSPELVDEVSRLFSGGLDILHVVGGGYMNSIWPDMLAEVHVAAKLAKAEGARIVLTGQGMHPMDSKTPDVVDALADVLEMAETADFRDASHSETGASALCDCVIESCDDIAIPPSSWLPTGPRTGASPARNPYGNVCVVGGLSSDSDADRRERRRTINEVATFVRHVLADKRVSRVNVLEMSPGDSALPMRALAGVCDRISVVRLWDMPVKDAIRVVAGAEWNIGERFHLAILSMSAGVPCMSWHGNEYYETKMRSAYASWGFAEKDGRLPLVPATDLIADALYEFASDGNLRLMRRLLAARHDDVKAMMEVKTNTIASAYALSKDEERRMADALRKMLADPASPDVSIVVPVYNMDEYLGQCLDSLSAQEGIDIEIICVDDGSTDQSPAILSERSWADPRIRVIRQRNMGVAAARNAGVEAARGRRIMFCDPDDWYADSHVVADLYEAAETHDAPVSAGLFAEYPEGGKGEPILSWSESLARYDFPRTGRVDYGELQFDFGWIRCMYDRRLIAGGRHPFPFRSNYEDPVWFVEVMSDAGWLWAIDRPVYCYRTGHKADGGFFESPRAQQSLDLLRGIIDNFRMADEGSLDSLHGLTMSRLVCAYSAPLLHILHAEGPEADEARRLLDEIGEREFGSGGGIRLISEMAWQVAGKDACRPSDERGAEQDMEKQSEESASEPDD